MKSLTQPFSDTSYVRILSLNHYNIMMIQGSFAIWGKAVELNLSTSMEWNDPMTSENFWKLNGKGNYLRNWMGLSIWI